MKCKNPKCYRELTSADLAFSKADGYCVQCWAAGVPELVAEIERLRAVVEPLEKLLAEGPMAGETVLAKEPTRYCVSKYQQWHFGPTLAEALAAAVAAADQRESDG